MRSIIVLRLFAAMVLFSTVSAAQYFGQNKVRYEDYDFKVLSTDHFDIYYYQREADVMQEIGRMAERWYARLSEILDHDLSSRQALILYADAADFRSTTVIPGNIGEGTGGVTEGLRRRIVMPLAGPLAETDHVLGHELVHAFQYDMSRRTRGQRVAGINVLPLWFVEGMAEYLSLGPVDANTAMWMRDAVLRDEVPKIKDLADQEYFPYRYGHALWAYLGGRFGDAVVAEALRAGIERGDPQEALSRVTGIDEDKLSDQWRETLKSEYAPIIERTNAPEQKGRVLVKAEERAGALNVSPAISPDGRYMMFLSERSLFAINLFLADARTGKVLKRITKSEINPHFSALQFTQSSGAWNADSNQFAYAKTEKSKPFIAIYDIEQGDTIRTLRFPDLGEITTVTWSPDGKSIAFSASQGGITDLFVTDLKSGKLTRLTNDRFADLHPAWSPDGKELVFTTDRFDSDPQVLSFGQYRLGILNIATGQIRHLATFDTGKNIDSQWAGDGKSLFFVSDQNGIPNVYRLSLANNKIWQVTDLQTGASGITPLSPALSVASEDGRVVYSAFTDGNYEIVSIESQTVAGVPVQRDRLAAQLNPATLPPREEPAGEINNILRNPRRGLIPGLKFERAEYDPSLALDFVAPPSVVAGSTAFGNVIGGGTAFHFSDMLNLHQLTLTVETTSGSGASHILRNLAAGATYLNQTSRWNWGFTGGQVPYVSGGFARGVATVDDEPVIVDLQIRIWQIEREAAGILQYPFSRAQRLEFQLGYRNIDFAGEQETILIDPFTGQLIREDTADIPTPDALHFANASTALVWDTSIFGGTSPVLGQSYRLQAGYSAGSLNFGTILADYRRYYRIARPLSIAGRMLHFGRYGGDSNADQLQPLFLGYESLVRGYTPNSFDARECDSGQATDTCPAYDRLLGSRMAVANAEVRLEMLGPLGIIPSRLFPPVQLSSFFDAGRAWGEFPGIPEESREWVSSYGASLRFNILGFAIGQVSLVHPNDRPLKSWHWEFSLLPGF